VFLLVYDLYDLRQLSRSKSLKIRFSAHSLQDDLVVLYVPNQEFLHPICRELLIVSQLGDPPGERLGVGADQDEVGARVGGQVEDHHCRLHQSESVQDDGGQVGGGGVLPVPGDPRGVHECGLAGHGHVEDAHADHAQQAAHKEPEHELRLGHTLIDDPGILGGAQASVQVAKQPVATEHLVAIQVHIERLHHVKSVRQDHAEAFAEGLQRVGEQEVHREGH